jgi:Zn-dependent M28 family amino/carboxypeptidase
VDPDGASGLVFDEVPSAFSSEKTSYQGGKHDGRPSTRPSIFLVKPAFLDLVMSGMKNNPNGAADIMKNYKPQQLDRTYLTSKVEILKEDTLYSNNVIGIVPGTDSLLRDEYIVVGGHLDHVAQQQGKPCNGADDNASGSAGVMEIARAVAMNPCKRTVVFVTWSGEEMGLLGSSYFLESGIIPKDKIKFNLNMDMIGRTGKGNESTRAHYVVTDKKYLKGLTAFIEELNTGITDFPILFDDDEHSPGGSDHMTFIQAGIPAFFFFSGVHADLHNPGDDPEKIDYPKAASICRLGYMITERLGNMAVVPRFE